MVNENEVASLGHDGDDGLLSSANHVLIGQSWWRRYRIWIITLFLAVMVGLAVALIPVPYVIYGPGPTFNVLGEQNGTKILEFSTAQSGDSQSDDSQSGEAATGELRMVTVSELGGPGSTVTLANVLRAWFTPGYAVYDYADVYPENVTVEQVQEASAAQMQSSHSTASVAALEYLGYELNATISVVGLSEGSGAQGVLEEGDVLRSITTPDGTAYPMDTPSAPFALMASVPVGTPLQVEVLRDGEPKTVTVVSTSGTESDSSSEQSGGESDSEVVEEEGSKLGIYLNLDIEDMPVEVTFHLEKVGGPSAGTIFALSIIDELTGGELAGDKSIAGTGSLNYDGTVQAIGGIEQKMYGALRDGAEWFLAPKSNCDSVVGAIPDGLEVVAVGNLDEAVKAVESIAQGNTSDLPSCEMVLEKG